MPVEKILNELKKYNKISSRFTDWRHIPAKSGIYEEFPEWIEDRLVRILKEKGISKLLSRGLGDVYKRQPYQSILYPFRKFLINSGFSRNMSPVSKAGTDFIILF